MAIDSEAIWEALADRLRDADGFRTFSRKRRNFGLEEHPVLMVLDDEGDEDLAGDPDEPGPTWKLTGELIILARSEREQDRPASILNGLVKTVRTALERKDSDPIGNGLSFYSDLGGLVRVLSVTKVEKGSGELSGQAVAKMYVELETNPG